MTNWVKEVKECDTSNLFRRLRERVRSDCSERNQDLGDEFVKFENDATRQFNVVAAALVAREMGAFNLSIQGNAF